MADDDNIDEALAKLRSQLGPLGDDGAGAFDKIAAAAKDAKAALDEVGKRTKDNKLEYDNLASAVNNLKEAQKSLAEIQEKRSKLDDADLSYNDKKVEGIKTQIDAEEALQKSIKARLKLGKISSEQAKQEREDSERRQENYRKEAKLAGEVGAATDTISEMFGIGTKLGDTFIGRLQMMGKSVGNFASRMQGDGDFRKGIVETFKSGAFRLNAMNAAATAGLQIFAAYAAAVFKIAMEIDGLAAGLAASTGAGRKHQQLLVDTRYELLGVGLSAEQASEAIGSLANRMSGFNRIQESTQGSLSKTVGELTALGVAADTSTDITNMLTKSMGVAADDVTGNLQRIAMMGVEIGAGPAEIMREYQEAMPYLVQFGSRAEEVFRGMKAMSEATGVSMGTLMSISKKTDTFEGAADMASQMNALMGMQLSTTELLMATSDERLDMIKREFDATGRSFSQMGRFEQQALATAAGFSSIDEAMRFFEASPAEIAANEAAMASATVNQEAFDQAVQDAIPAMTRLINAFRQLFLGVDPLLDAITLMVNKITALSAENKKMIGVVGFAAAAFAGLFGAVLAVVTILSAKLIVIAVAVTGAFAIMAIQVYKAYEAFQEAGGGIEGFFIASVRMMTPLFLIIDLFEATAQKMGLISEETSIVNDVIGFAAEAFGLWFDVLKAIADLTGFTDFMKDVIMVVKFLSGAIIKNLAGRFEQFANDIKAVTAAIRMLREWLNKRSSPSIFEQFERMPGLFGGMKSGLQGLASLFQSIATAISSIASSVRELFVGGFTKVMRLAAYSIGGAEAVGLVENGVSPGGGVAAAAGNRTTAIANTTNINNVNGATGDMQATINLTVDLGKNRVFHDAVMTVLHAEARN
jgi:hypothetical protein